MATYTHFYTLHTHTFSFIFLVLFTERACPQLAKANLAGPCLNKQITKLYRQKLINKKKKYSTVLTNVLSLPIG